MKMSSLGRIRFQTLTSWLAFTALFGSANPGRAASGRSPLTFAPTCRIRGHPEVEITLNCGDGNNSGVVQYWHTPFGGLQTPGFHTELDPVFMHHDGSLVIPNSSLLHSGLYYCLLQRPEGTTLWPYDLHVLSHQEQEVYEERNSCAAVRFRRNAGSAEEKSAGVSDGLFAGAVVASVLLTFVVGFCAGALSRNYVLRCLATVAMKLQSRKQQEPDTPDHSSQVAMTTLPPMYTNRSFEAEEVMHDDSTSTDTTISSTTASPPPKPQRSFRQKRAAGQEATAYLEGCDYIEEERAERDGGAGRGGEESTGCDGEAEEGDFGGVYLLEDVGSRTETDVDKCSEDEEENDGDESREEQRDWGLEEENKSKKHSEEIRRGEEVEETTSTEVEESHTETSDNKTSITEDPSPSAPPRGRRSRVIRLYQYNEDGERFHHLPDTTPQQPVPPPRLKQRSRSLTRLNAIMAAAAAGPMEEGDAERGEREEKPGFHMEI
ncbi:uncharacterized protein LOC133441487 [Cololabis saira]|uniref:uncharacterized protein LOC133441487 n=1 Tax=Cololabis saira TaxID=129043 RepID=UPI002AD53632|nr:uncharacterized protein LOC133441487 [Cololabis saira]